jgi:hypothetical protein
MQKLKMKIKHPISNQIKDHCPDSAATHCQRRHPPPPLATFLANKKKKRFGHWVIISGNFSTKIGLKIDSNASKLNF